MPTGYTASILDGATFEQFVWGCARGMFAFVMQRDDDPKSSPVLEDEPTDYYQNGLKMAIAKANQISRRSSADWKNTYDVYLADAKKHLAEKVEKDRITEERYRNMLESVQAWNPPSSNHIDFKSFMIEQIQQSIKHDCGGLEFYQPMDFEKWKSNEISSCRRDIEYHTQENQKEIDRVEGRNRWKRQLLESVKLPEKFL